MKITITNLKKNDACHYGVSAFADIFGKEAYLSNIFGYYYAVSDGEIEIPKDKFYNFYDIEEWLKWLIASMMTIEDVNRFAIKCLDVVIENVESLIDEGWDVHDFEDRFARFLDEVALLDDDYTHSVASHIMGFYEGWLTNHTGDLFFELEKILNG